MANQCAGLGCCECGRGRAMLDFGGVCCGQDRWCRDGGMVMSFHGVYHLCFLDLFLGSSSHTYLYSLSHIYGECSPARLNL